MNHSISLTVNGAQREFVLDLLECAQRPSTTASSDTRYCATVASEAQPR